MTMSPKLRIKPFRSIATSFSFSKRTYSLLNTADLVVIGSGPGGYVSAIKAAQLGMKTICIEKQSTIGGNSVHVGCIPSKSLLCNSYYYYMAKSGNLNKKGIEMDNIHLNLDAIMKQKQFAISSRTGSLLQLFKKNNIHWIKGHGKITGVNQVTAVKEDGSTEVTNTKNIIIATGSEVKPHAKIVFIKGTIVCSTGAMMFKEVPKRLVIVGSGTIALELGSVWSRLGSKVTIIGSHPLIGGASIDEEVAKSLQKILSKQGLTFKLDTKVTGATKSGKVIKVRLQAVKDETQREELECDIVLLSVGRRPYTSNLGLEEMGIKRDEEGRIPVNALFQTAISNIYGVGDCIQGPMLASKAGKDGLICVEGMMGSPVRVNYKSLPSAIYTHPEVGWVGKTEKDLMNEGVAYKVGRFPFLANCRAKINNDTEGFVKVLADRVTNKILGTHIIGSTAGDLINEAALAQEYGSTSKDVSRVCHAHPTCAEALKEANLAAYFGKPINY